MRRSEFMGLTVALLLVPALPVAAAEPQTGMINRTISVSGTGTVMAAPDMVSVSGGVITKAQRANDALARNSAAMQAVFEMLRRNGVAQNDMQTSSFSISPEYYQGKNNSNQPLAITGYRVSNQLDVKVRHVGSLGGILDALVRQGVNNIHTIIFSVSKRQSKMDTARRMAFEDAHRKASLYAQTTGTKLGKILTISEHDGFIKPSPRFAARPMAIRTAVPIAGGEQSLRVSVSVSWALE